MEYRKVIPDEQTCARGKKEPCFTHAEALLRGFNKGAAPHLYDEDKSGYTYPD